MHQDVKVRSWLATSYYETQQLVYIEDRVSHLPKEEKVKGRVKRNNITEQTVMFENKYSAGSIHFFTSANRTCSQL